jgi:hypothetical protein
VPDLKSDAPEDLDAVFPDLESADDSAGGDGDVRRV